MKGYTIPFLIGFAVSGAGFLVLDLVIMHLQGLSLLFQS
jgi:hypothetical protein